MISFPVLTSTIDALAFSPDSASLAVGGESLTELWDLARMDQPRHRFNRSMHGEALPLVFIRRPPALVHLAFKCVVGYDPGSGARAFDFGYGTDIVGGFDMLPDGRLFLGRRGADGCPRAYEGIRIVRGEPVSVWAVPGAREANWKCHAAVTAPARGEVAFGEYEEGEQLARVSFRNADTGELLATAKFAAKLRLRRLAASPDGRWVAALCGRLVSVIDRDAPTAPPVLLKGSRLAFTLPAFHPSGRFLAVTSNDGRVTLFEAGTWRPAHALDWQIGQLRCLAFSADGALGAAGSDTRRVVVWDVDL